MSDIVHKPGNGGLKKDPFELLKQQVKRGAASVVSTEKLIYIAVDASSSMDDRLRDSSTSKIDAVKKAGSEILARYQSRAKFKIISFSNNAMTHESIQDIDTRGSTNIMCALELMTSGSHGVLLSDGGENQGNARGEIPRLIAEKVVVHTIGCGRNANRELLKEISDSTGGSFMMIDEDYTQIFTSLDALVSRAVAALNAASSRAIEVGGETR